MASIAVDARPLAQPLTGIGRYTKELLDRLLPASPHMWYLYSDRPLLTLPRGAERHVVRTGTCRGRLSSLLFAQLVYPRWAKQDRIDLFWSPRHHLPLGLGASTASVVTVCDLVWQRCPESMRRSSRLLESLLMPRSVAKASHIITISKSTARDLGELLECPSEKVAVIYPGANSPSSNPRDIDRRQSAAPYFLFVGTHEPRKNLRRLLLAYADLVRCSADVPRLVIAGMPGWGDQAVSAWIEELALGEQVTSLGYVSDDRLEALYTGAMLLLAPSLYEGFCLPVIEAISRGVPVITSDVSSMPEAAGRAGLLVDPYSIDEIRSAMEAALDSERLAALRQECAAHAAAFSWDRAASETASLIERVMQNDL